MTRKYDNRIIAKTFIEDGFWTQLGFFNFKFGGSSTVKGRLYNASNIFVAIYRKYSTGRFQRF